MHFLTYPRLWCLRGPLLSQCIKTQLWLSLYWAPYCAHYSHVIAQQSIRAIILWLLQMMQLLQLMMSQCRGETWKNLLAGVMQTICGKFGEHKRDCGGRRRPHILQALLIRGKAVVTIVKYLTAYTQQTQTGHKTDSIIKTTVLYDEEVDLSIYLLMCVTGTKLRSICNYITLHSVNGIYLQVLLWWSHVARWYVIKMW